MSTTTAAERDLTRFGLIDYCVFSAVLFLSALIGFYHAWNERKKKSLDNVLLGGRKLKVFPVGMSIMASFTSAISILGFSLEMYRFGSMYLLIGLSYFITQPFAAHVYLPFYHKLKITSAYEYLEMRFSNLVRQLASLTFCIEMFLYMAVVLYSPSLAIQQVTGIPLWVSIFLNGLICTLYTSLGGMKAVVFTDTFQVLIMFAGLVAIIIEGTIRIGGVDLVYDRLVEGQRLEFLDFNPSLLQRHTFWSIMIGGFFTSLTVYASNQATIQRYFTLPTIRAAQLAMYWNLLGTVSILICCCVCGFVAFAFYYGCDPLLAGKISVYDQILPYLVLDLLEDFYGLPGLFIACVYSAALSTISSGLNSLTAVVIHDFIQPISKKRLEQNTSMFVSKILAAMFGIITIGLSFLCKYAGSTVLQVSLSIFGILGGPLLGVISLGMFIPFANAKGALCGLVLSVLVNLWLGICSVLYGQKPKPKPLTQHLCPDFMNSTMRLLSTLPNQTQPVTISAEQSSFKFADIYNLSYYWFSLTGIIIVLIVGMLVSLLTGKQDLEQLQEHLYIDLFGINKKKFKILKTNMVNGNKMEKSEMKLLGQIEEKNMDI